MQVEPDWSTMYDWARNMAWNMKPNNYWIAELAQAAVVHVLETWERYRHLPDQVFTRTISVIMYHEMLRVLGDYESRRAHVEAKKNNPSHLLVEPKERLTEEDALSGPTGDEVDLQVEKLVDFQTVNNILPSILSKSENRVMRMIIDNDGSTNEEIAGKLGDLSEGAVKIHKYNSLKKLKSLFRNDIILFWGTTLR